MCDKKSDYHVQMEIHLCREYNLSPEQSRTMVQMGCQDIKKNLDKIAAIVIDKEESSIDSDSLKNAAHSLKGVLLNLGLQAEAEIALKLERATENCVKLDAVEKLLAIAKEV